MIDFEKEILDMNTYPFIFSKKFYKILLDINDSISINLIKMFKNKEMVKETFIDITDKEDIISFIPSEKINKLIKDNKFDSKKISSDPQKVEMKIGRLIFKLIGDKYQQKDIEDFVNNYKAILKNKSLYRNFRIVSGEDIKKWYLEKNYAIGDGGTLSKSCMKFRYAQTFFDIYTKNPDKIRLLILLDENKEFILGRALLWTMDMPKGAILMDRIYYSQDHILNMFINYAIKNEWYYKLDSNTNPMISYFNEKPFKIRMSIKIKKLKYENFPFIDSIGFYDPSKYILTNDPKYLKKLNCKEYYDLCDHLGGYEIRKDFNY